MHAKIPAETPAIRGVLCLHDIQTGDLLAVIDSTHLTAVRTGLAGALAAHVLARPEADVVAVIGAGVQGTHQLRSFAALRPLRRVAVFDLLDVTRRVVRTQLGTAGDRRDIGRGGRRGRGYFLVATWSPT